MFQKNVANNVDRVKFKGTMTNIGPHKNKHLEQHETRRTTRHRHLEYCIFFIFRPFLFTTNKAFVILSQMNFCQDTQNDFFIINKDLKIAVNCDHAIFFS